MFCRELNRGKCKTYLIADEGTRRAMLIDPLKENTGRYIAVAAYHGFRLDYVADTHTHADHRSGTFDVAELTDAKVVMERHAPAPHVAIHVSSGDVLALGDLEVKLLPTPGHTPDSMCLSVDDRVFTGDTLLIGGTGRTDFPGGDSGKQYDGIVNALFTLPDDTIVLPGHDYRGNHSTTIGREKAANPRLAGKTRAQYIDIMNNLGLQLPDKIQEALQANQTAIDDDSLKFPDLNQLSAIRQIPAADLKVRLDSSHPPVIIDVREPEEYKDEHGHIRTSRLIPLRALPARAVELESLKGSDIVVVCRAGIRSTTAAAVLTALGFEHVSNLKGGMLEWNEAGYPVER